MSLAAAPPSEEQLTLEVGVAFKKPESSSFKIGGALATSKHELDGDDTVDVVLMDSAGEIIARSPGRVTFVGFKKHRPKNERAWVERIHSIELGAIQEQIH
jgi:ABC-type lipoprotein release transport system permease subunit